MPFLTAVNAGAVVTSQAPEVIVAAPVMVANSCPVSAGVIAANVCLTFLKNLLIGVRFPYLAITHT
jgi:hypothetical protein